MVRRSDIRETAYQIFRHRTALAGAMLILAVILTAVFALWIMPYDPILNYPSERFLPPSSRHYMGTDDLGRDIFSRVVFGARISLWVGLLSTLASAAVGILLGVISGYFGSVIDIAIMRVADVIFAFPDILLALTVVAILGSGANNVIVALAVVYTPIFIRLTRGVALSVKERPYVEAARAIGEGDLGIITRSILPSCFAPVVVQGTLTLSYAILAEAALSFLGLGVPPPIPSWGRMLSDSQTFMANAPWCAFFPGIAILLTVLAFNLFGDGLRDAFDVRLRD